MEINNKAINENLEAKIRKLSDLILKHIQIDAAKSHQYADKLISLSKKENNQRALAVGYNLKAVTYYFCSDFKNAIDFYHKGYDIAKKINYYKHIHMALNNLGIIYEEINDFEKAINCFTETLEYGDKVGQSKKMITKTLINIGQLYRRLENFKEAKKYFSTGLQYAKEVNSKPDIALSYLDLSYIEKQENNLSRSIEFAENAKKHSVTQADPDTHVFILEQLGLLYHKNNEISKSICNYESALKIAMEIDHPKLITDVYISLVNIYSEIDSEKACDYLKKAEKIAKKLQIDAIDEKLFKVAYEFFESTKDYKNALIYHKKYFNMKKLILNQEKKQRIKSLEERMELEKQLYEKRSLNKQNKKLKHAYKQLRLINSVGQKINAVLETNKVINYVRSTLEKNYHINLFAISFYNSENNKINVKYLFKDNKRIEPIILKLKNETLAKNLFKTHKSILYKNGYDSLLDNFENAKKIKRFFNRDENQLFVPLLFEEKTIGVIIVQFKHTEPMISKDYDFIESLASFVAIGLKNARAYEMIQKNKEKIINLEKRNAVLAMAVTANHEINQPLMLIQGSIELLESTLNNSTDLQKKYLKNLYMAVDRITNILNKYKDLRKYKYKYKSYSKLSEMIEIEENE